LDSAFVKIALLLALLAAPALARAALGDTEAQCLEKYGHSLNETAGSGIGEKLVFYEQGGFGIGVEYWKGRAACLFFKKTLRTEKISDDEIEKLLKENSGGSPWDFSHVIGEGKRWARKDGRAIANYDARQGLLIIMTDEFAIQRMKNKPASGQ
jgi:hypothetical protein